MSRTSRFSLRLDLNAGAADLFSATPDAYSHDPNPSAAPLDFHQVLSNSRSTPEGFTEFPVLLEYETQLS